MTKRLRPQYTNKNSTQTLREGLKEYYAANPSITDPRELPQEFAKILLAHDVSHVVYGCDTDMYDELKILPLGFGQAILSSKTISIPTKTQKLNLRSILCTMI